MNFKVTATPNGKGKVKITVTRPDGTSYVHAEKAKEGRFTHYAVVTQEITGAAINRHIRREKRHTIMAEGERQFLEARIGETDTFVVLATRENRAAKAQAYLGYAEVMELDTFEVETA